MSLYVEPKAKEKISKNWIQRSPGGNQKGSPRNENSAVVLWLDFGRRENKSYFNKAKQFTVEIMNSSLCNTHPQMKQGDVSLA